MQTFICEARVHDSIQVARIQLGGTLEISYRFAPATLASVHRRRHCVNFGVIRQAAPRQLDLGASTIVIEKTVKPVFGSSEMNFACAGLKLGRLLQSYVGLVAPGRIMIVTAEVKAHVLLTHQGIGKRELRIARDRLLKQLNRVPQRLVFGRLVFKLQGFLVKRVRSNISRRRTCDRCFLISRDFGLKLFRNGPRYLALDSENIREITVVGLRPNVGIRACID